MKSILITGASSGIGLATAKLFLQDGWRVGLVARRADKLHALADTHPGAVPLPCDVTDPAAMDAAFATFCKDATLDALFNNAGTFGPSAPIDEVTPEQFDAVMNVNLRGMFIAARLAFKHMRHQTPQGGRIINNGSLSAHVPRPGSVCYTVSKHAITGLTRTLSLDGRAFDIACGQIDIGNAESEMVANLKAAHPDMHTMDAAHAAQSVLHMARMPLNANVQFMTVMATQMPYIGRG
ncbi:SDR family oxidoreductase [Roseovarius sp. LXJ103]|uniref:SDR family oxidoreductase n=1 Tax=Roseovarius carneus TaxID=2853164 RepID=UPI000D607A10|nr:SDR family oxidoreductase [Roseovarius carneus]MBZ8118243.1 SDR family oxidoreductase [Roseovarius carneus]PWE36035.1 short-chain dehydrogenase [Pelagicola sp. LXJ1103]